MDYCHVEVDIHQHPKRNQSVPGDVAAVERAHSATTIVVADGLGSGIQANMAANLYVSRFCELIRQEVSFREAFRRVVQSLHDARGSDLPYACLSVARIFSSGSCTLLSYEMPPPVVLVRGYPSVAQQKTFLLGNEVVAETELSLGLNDGVVLFSDGVSQAGLGPGNPTGWQSEGVARFLRTIGNARLTDAILAEARRRSGGYCPDDSTVAFAHFRKGNVLNILTGPPADPSRDSAVVAEFMAAPGLKIVCGGTTAEVVARETRRPVRVSGRFSAPMEPPAYAMDGIELVTEGAVTLNQVYNILLENPDSYTNRESAVQMFGILLHVCDRINLWHGGSKNLNNSGILFRQLGVSSREEVVERLVARLRELGKAVNVHNC